MFGKRFEFQICLPDESISNSGEFKYDGERAQLHVLEDGSVMIFSRNSENNTSEGPSLTHLVLSSPITTLAMIQKVWRFRITKNNVAEFLWWRLNRIIDC
jgi:hypothetical protein